MHCRLQFGVRENRASNRRHESRLEVRDLLHQDYIEGRNDSAPDPMFSHNRLSVRTADADNAASPRAAKGEENENVAGSVRVALARPSSHGPADGFEPLLASPEAARLLGNIHVKTLQRYTRRGHVPGYQIEGHWYFRASELDSWLRSRINSSCHPCRLQEKSDGT
jgi:hypothetical protein